MCIVPVIETLMKYQVVYFSRCFAITCNTETQSLNEKLQKYPEEHLQVLFRVIYSRDVCAHASLQNVQRASTWDLDSPSLLLNSGGIVFVNKPMLLVVLC